MLTPIQGKVGQLAIASLLIVGAAAIPQFSWAQSPGDIVVIGNSPDQWQRHRSYWNQLLNLNGPTPRPGQGEQSLNRPTVDPRTLQEEILRNLQVSDLRLEPIIRLNGSSQLIGTLNNRNSTAVTVAGVNFEILDSKGNLVQTGVAVPQPATIAPGQAVTFQTALATIPPDGGFQVRLAQPPIVLQGGV